MNSADNNALLAFARIFKLDGDWMTCTSCKRNLIASRNGEPFKHEAGCKNSQHLHPWRALRGILTGGRSTKAQRLEHANSLIRIISSHGRRFFYSECHKRGAYMELDQRGRIWLVDDHTGQRVFTGVTPHGNDWRGFSHGGTLRSLIEDLRDYISKGTMLRRTIIASPHWAYSQEAALATQAEAFNLPMFCPASECATAP